MATMADTTMGEAQVANDKREGSPLEQPEEKRRKAAAELTWEELKRMDYNKMNAEEKDKWREEYKKDERLRHPWWDETDRLWSEPPDINYRRIILYDQEVIERLFEDKNLHFTERCLRYQQEDVNLECNVLVEYLRWIREMLKNKNQDQGPKSFLDGLWSFVIEDFEVVRAEDDNNHHQTNARMHTRRLQEKGPTQFYCEWKRGWFYYDLEGGKWHKEPSEAGAEYKLRREEWRKEALSKAERRYYDCVERRFYRLHQEEGVWVGEQQTYAAHDSWSFEYDREKRQWYPNKYLKEILRERAAEMAANDQKAKEPPAEAADHEEVEGQSSCGVNEDPASPSSSVDIQAELDAQLATDVHGTTSP